HPYVSHLSFAAAATPEIYPLSLHDALPICLQRLERGGPELQAEDVAFPRQQVVVDVHAPHRAQVAADDGVGDDGGDFGGRRLARSEEHTSELQSRENLVCRLLLEKKKL